MEAFESFCKLAIEAEHLVVTSGVKFPIARETKKVPKRAPSRRSRSTATRSTSSGARAGRLVLGSVKTYLGSKGVRAGDVRGEGAETGRYRLLNDPVIREGFLAGAAEWYGYERGQVKIRLYVGKWASTRGVDNRKVTTDWCD